jgi:hypothetical protein
VEGIRRAPKRACPLNEKETRLALQNALRYVAPEHHATLAPEFLEELKTKGRIYGYRFRPAGGIKAKPIDEYRGQCLEGKAFQVMIDNNLDFDVALDTSDPSAWLQPRQDVLSFDPAGTAPLPGLAPGGDLNSDARVDEEGRPLPPTVRRPITPEEASRAVGMNAVLREHFSEGGEFAKVIPANAIGDYLTGLATRAVPIHSTPTNPAHLKSCGGRRFDGISAGLREWSGSVPLRREQGARFV